MVVKYSRDAKKNETLESRKAADIYMSARNGTDSWITYPSFNREIIQNAAALIPTTFTEVEIRDFMRDKNLINVNYYAHRDKFVKAAREWTLRNYEEKNEYYRMIAGLPPIGAPDLYFDDVIYEAFDLEKTPIHLVHQNVLNSMDLDGSLDEFQTRYPSYRYISHLGNRRIDVGLARMADNFDVLYIPKKIDNESYQRDFLRAYDQAKEYILTVVYNMYYSAKYEYYDNYLAFITLMMAVQYLINNAYKIVVNRDFYDLESIRTFLTAYNIPYSGFFTIYQNRLLVKNLNILLQKKSTTRVLIDVMDLLGFTDYELIKYYLVKRHKTDRNGMPILKYLKDENGEYLLDEKGEKIIDAESVYEFYFSGIPIESDDVQQDILNSDYVMSYDEMVKDDNLWIDDAETKQLLMETDFNYMQTKYIDVKVVYKLQEIVFETVYASRMILDNAEDTKRIKVTMNLLSDTPVSLFDSIVMLICLMCKMHGMEPTLYSKLSEVAHILGFNFDADFEAIKSNIMYNRIAKRKGGSEYVNVENLYNSNIAKYITKTTFNTPNDVNRMFVNVKELRNLLVQGMADADNLTVYYAYKTLYESLMYTEVNNSIYNLKDGTTPETFADYLRESNYELYDIYQNIDTEMVPDYIDYITQRLGTLFKDTKYFPYIKLLSGEDIDALLKLLRFFKSYTVSIRKAHINLMLDDRYDNMVHVISSMKFKVSMKMGEDFNFLDDIDGLHGLIKMSDNSTHVMDKLAFIVHNFMIREYVEGIHKPKFIGEIHQNDPFDLIDVIREEGTLNADTDRVHIHNHHKFIGLLNNDYTITTTENVKYDANIKHNNKIRTMDDVTETVNLNQVDRHSASDQVGTVQEILMRTGRSVSDKHHIDVSFYNEDEAETVDVPFVDEILQIKRDKATGGDELEVDIDMSMKDSASTRISQSMNTKLNPNDSIHGSDSIIRSNVNMVAKDKATLYESVRFIYTD